MTFLDLATQVLKQIGALLQGETPSAAEANDVLFAANLLIKSLNSERLSIYSLKEAQYALNAGDQTMDIGPGAVRFPGARPVLIQTAAWSPNVYDRRQTLDLLNPTQWSAIEDRSIQGLIVRKLYYDYAFPVATLNISPIPLLAGKLWLTAWFPFTEFATVGDDITQFPDQYFNVLFFGLCIRMPQQYGQPVDPANGQLYADAVEKLRAFNAQYMESMVNANQQLGSAPAIGVPPRGPLSPMPPVVPAPPTPQQ